jgi:hypothetical protein
MASQWSEQGFLEWASDPSGSPPTWAAIMRDATPTIPDGDSGRVLVRGLQGDAGFEQAMASPGARLKFNYQGNVSDSVYFPELAMRNTGGVWAKRAPLPVFGLQGGINATTQWYTQLGVVIDEFTLSCAAPGDPWVIDAVTTTSNHRPRTGTTTPASTGAGVTFRSTKGGLVTIKVGGAAHAAFRVQSQSYTIRNNPIPDTSLDEDTRSDDGDELWFPPGFEPGDQIVSARLTFKDPIPYDEFVGSAWTAYEVIAQLTDGTTLQELEVGPLYRAEGRQSLITEGQYVFGCDLESLPGADAWAFDPNVT